MTANRKANWAKASYDSVPTLLKETDFRGKRVFIKPNAMMPWRYPTDTATITDVRVIRALVDQLNTAGCRSILVGDCGFRGQWEKTICSSGYEQIEGAEVRCLMDVNSKDRGTMLRLEPGEYLSLYGAEVSNLALACDAWITAAKMKVHPLARVTLSIKNLMGAITKGKGSIHPKWSRPILHKRLRDLYFLLRDYVALAVVDGIVGLEYSLSCGVPVNSGVIVWGSDPFEVDVLSCRLMGIRPDRVGYLRLIGERLGIDVKTLYEDVSPVVVYEEALFYQRNSNG